MKKNLKFVQIKKMLVVDLSRFGNSLREKPLSMENGCTISFGIIKSKWIQSICSMYL